MPMVYECHTISSLCESILVLRSTILLGTRSEATAKFHFSVFVFGKRGYQIVGREEFEQVFMEIMGERENS